MKRRNSFAGLALLGLAAAFPAGAPAQQTSVTITGTISREGNIPLAQATVLIPTLGVSTASRSNGTYSLVVPATRAFGQEVTIIARLVGYSADSARIRLEGSAITKDFTLKPNPFQIGELVVTGAGTRADFRQLGTERKSLDSTTILRTNETNLVQALSGRLAGVHVNQASGEVGTNSRIQIRGIRSLQGGSQPLIVVDGVAIINSTNISASSASGQLGGTTSPNRAGDLNPDDIESIEILSGASSAAVYGADAGNGVILITTKKGRAGRTTFSFRTTYQADKPTEGLPMQTRFGVGLGGVSPACLPGGTANCIINAGFQSWGPALAAGTQTYDHSREIYQTGMTLDNAISMQGGNDRTTFLLSAGYLDQDGFITTSRDYFKRTNVRLSGQHFLSDNLRVSANVTYVQTSGNFIPRGNTVNGLLLGSLRTPPEFNNVDYLTDQGLHRSWRFPNPSGVAAQRSSRGFDNPFYALNTSLNTQRTGRYFGNVAAEWLALPWLRVNYTIGADYDSEDRVEARGIQSSGLTPSQGSIVARWQFDERLIQHNLSATASYRLSEKIEGTFLLGQQLSENVFRQVRAQGNILVAESPFRIDNTTVTSPPTDAETRTRGEGYVAQGKMGISNQLFLTATLRNDGSSTFGTTNLRAWYPQGSIAWNFSEAFSTGFVNFGKLRAAYGQTGIVPTAYQLQSVFLGGANRFSDFNPGSQTLPSLGGNGGLYTSDTLGNPGLKPERVAEFSTGTDLSFLRDRIDLSYTYYHSKSTDVILGFPLAPSTGAQVGIRNAAEIENKGHELQLNVRPFTTSNLAIDIGATWNRNRNKVLSFGDPNVEFVFWQTSFGGRTVNAQVGYPLGVIRGRDFARCGRGLTDATFPGIAAACTGAADGALFIAANGFPVADPTDRVLGDPNPDWTGGLRLGVMLFQRLNITGFLDVRQGGLVQNMTRASMYGYGTHKDTEIRGQTRTFGEDIFEGETVVGPGAGMGVVIGEGWFNGQGGIGGPPSQFMEDASYTRLREVSASYTFDQPWVRRLLGLRALDVRVAGRNLITWSDYQGFDPETAIGGLSGATAASQGFDWFNHPLAKAFVLSLSFNW